MSEKIRYFDFKKVDLFQDYTARNPDFCAERIYEMFKDGVSSYSECVFGKSVKLVKKINQLLV